jgi:hypothetical protein
VEGDLSRLSALSDPAKLGRAALWLEEHCSGGRRDGDLASRVLIAGPPARPQAYALQIARRLAADGGRTLILDTSQAAASISTHLEAPRSPGLAELCRGHAGFEAVIRRDPDSGCHFLASGRPRAVGGPWGEPGAADRVFRALDDIYQWLVFCAETPEALVLAANIRCQFAAAILIDDGLDKAQPPLEQLLSRHGFPILRIS